MAWWEDPIQFAIVVVTVIMIPYLIYKILKWAERWF